MGAWGTKNFENDAAMDFLYDVEDHLDIDFLIEKIEECLEDEEFMDSWIASEGLAAAELFAAANGNPSADYNPEDIVQSFVSATLQSKMKDEHIELLMHFLDKVVDGKISELCQLWMDSDLFDEWNAVVEDLRNRLQ